MNGVEIPLDGSGHIGAVQTYVAPTIDPLPPGAGELTGQTGTVNVGFGKVKVSQTSVGSNITNLVFDTTNLAISERKLVLGGIPLTLFTRGDGKDVLAVYEVDGTSNQLTSSEFSNSLETYVYFGIRYGTYTDGSNRLYTYVEGDGDTITVDKFVWKGSPLALNSNGSIICKKITGTTDSVNSLYLGGVPLKYVTIDGRKYLAVIPF